jgi:hypothetical protein
VAGGGTDIEAPRVSAFNGSSSFDFSNPVTSGTFTPSITKSSLL